MAVALCATYMCNFYCKKHLHLLSVLNGMYSIYGFIIDDYWMGIVMVIVGEDTSKPKIVSLCLN